MNSPSNTSPSQLSSTEAAQRYGLTNDHIASLCRRGKVEGHLAGGRIWFVEEPSLQSYLARTKEERAARARKLSKKIKSEYAASAEPAYTPSWRMAGSGLSLATAVLVVGALYLSIPMAASDLADVPWSYMPAAVAETSREAYAATFIPAAEHYLVFADGVAQVQANSYATLGAAVASVFTKPIALSAPGPEQVIPAFAVASPAALVNAPQQMAAALTAPPLALPRLPSAPVAQASSEQLLRTAWYFPQSLADVLVSGWSDMATWYAQLFLSSAQTLSDAQVAAYQSAAVGEVEFSSALLQGWATFEQSTAEHFVNGVYTAAYAVAYTQQAVLETMWQSTDTIGLSVAGAIRAVGDSAQALALAYKESSDRIATRTSGSAHAASVYDAWTDWLAKHVFAPEVSHTPTSAIGTPEYGAGDKVCVDDTCVSREEFLEVFQKSR